MQTGPAAGLTGRAVAARLAGMMVERAGLASGLAGRGRVAAAVVVAAVAAVGLWSSAPARAGDVVLGPALDGAMVDPAVAGADVFPSGGQITLELDLTSLGLGPLNETVRLSSEGLPDTIVQRGPLDPATGTIETEIVQLQLTGNSETLGQVFVNAGSNFGLTPSRGRIDHVVLDDNGRLVSGDSFFDVFAEVFIPGRVADPTTGFPALPPVAARNEVALHVQDRIRELPPNYPDQEPKSARAIDHFKCYTVSQRTKFRKGAVRLNDQFESARATVVRPVSLCNPVRKNGSPVKNPRQHLVCYAIRPGSRGFEKEAVGIHNQFGDETVDVLSRKTLCVPSRKRVLRGPTRPTRRAKPRPLSHFKCYRIQTRQPFQTRQVRLVDQFESQQARALAPTTVCNPVEKITRKNRKTTKTKIINQRAHLVAYPIKRQRPFRRRVVRITNQFGTQDLNVVRRESILLPTHKTPCTEYAEEAKAALMAQGVQIGTINNAIHVPFQGRPDGDCP